MVVLVGGVGLGFYDLATAQAGSAHANTLARPAHLGPHRSQIDIPPPFGHVVRVANIIPKLRPFAADITNLCHIRNSRLIDSEGTQEGFRALL